MARFPIPLRLGSGDFFSSRRKPEFPAIIGMDKNRLILYNNNRSYPEKEVTAP